MDVTSIVAANAKRIREQKKLTLEGAAAATGVSRSMLAQIEKGEVNPTISVLWKIANGYKVSFTALVEDGREGVRVVRKGEQPPLEADGGRYLNHPLFALRDNRPFEMYRIVVKPQGSLEAQPHLKGAEEYIAVFAGQVEIGVGEERYRLEAGDAIRFCADQPHSYRSLGEEEVQLSMVIYYSK